ncbi:MAG: hypothetical protein JRJ54_15675 [Deltaproteobacteria bacterium]|nr:hypothetical protein [Deltaproteobacteria bacterium]
MINNDKILTFFIIVIIFLTINAYAGNVSYYSPTGEKITKEKYNQLNNNRAIEFQEIQKLCKKALSEMKDFLGRPLYDKEGNLIDYSSNIYQINSNTKRQGYDEYGRPLFDEKGRRFMYDVSVDNFRKQYGADYYRKRYLESGKPSDLVKYQRELEKAWGVSSSSTRTNLDAAYEADRAMERFLKSGKPSDLVRYQRALERALGQ